jgi:polyphosphate kinase 2 (PPK2 family)
MRKLAPDEVLRRRPGHVREWERMLTDEGTTVVKVFLNVSKDEQRTRLQERIDNPEKRWKFQLEDLDARKRFDDYVAAYEEALTQTSTEWAPWHVVPADRNWVKAVAVAQLLVDALEQIDPKLPEPERGIEALKVD